MEIEPISGPVRLTARTHQSGPARLTDSLNFLSNNTNEFPCPQHPGRRQRNEPFTEYIMNELELKATSEDDIRARDKTLNAIFAEDHAHDVGGGAASAGCTPATPQEGNELKLEATSLFVPETRPLTPSLLRITPLASVVAQHCRQVARQRRRKKEVISQRLEQWQPSLL